MSNAYFLSDRDQFIYKWGLRREFRNLLFAKFCSQRRLRPCEYELMHSVTVQSSEESAVKIYVIYIIQRYEQFLFPNTDLHTER